VYSQTATKQPLNESCREWEFSAFHQKSKRKSEIFVFEELRGLYHGNLVVFDGGSSLADHGLIKIVDEEGTAFATNLHESCFEAYDSGS
jgi:hypothetical protein